MLIKDVMCRGILKGIIFFEYVVMSHLLSMWMVCCYLGKYL
jgi:hypothetical protein